MNKGRMEAFSDGVIAILITIMVFDVKPPRGADLDALRQMLPLLSTYVMSFLYLGIYWNNHHHMLQLVRRVDGGVLWANLHLLFWLSLLPFATNWLHSSGFQAIPAAVYGLVLLFAAFAYLILQTVLVRAEGPDSALGRALGRDGKGKLSPLIYVAGVALAFIDPRPAILLYAVVALLWLVPDRRIEAHLRSGGGPSSRDPLGDS